MKLSKEDLVAFEDDYIAEDVFNNPNTKELRDLVKKYNAFRFNVVEWKNPEPVKQYSKDEIQALEAKMKKEGKL